MQAAYYTGNKQFCLRPAEAVTPQDDEVCLEVGFVGVCGTDMHIYHGIMDQRVAPPQIIGHEMSGTIISMGPEVHNFEIGDRVVVRPLDYCGHCPACDNGLMHICHNLKFMGVDSAGAFQNFWTVKARTLHKLPDAVSLQQGALIEPLAVACHDVARARLRQGEKAVVLGGGPIGQLIALVAQAIGAEVMMSEINPTRQTFSENNGVLTVNPLTEDLPKVVDEWTNGKGADVIFEVSGVQASIDVMTSIAAVRARICMVAIHSEKPTVDLFQFFWKELELVGARVYQPQDFEQAIELVATHQIDLAPFITSISALADIEQAFSGMDNSPQGMKALVACQQLDVEL
ncbi:MAG: alcohol dehydrogenase catalytic domain-containing protein [Pseudomonadales bacterium]